MKYFNFKLRSFFQNFLNRIWLYVFGSSRVWCWKTSTLPKVSHLQKTNFFQLSWDNFGKYATFFAPDFNPFFLTSISFVSGYNFCCYLWNGFWKWIAVFEDDYSKFWLFLPWGYLLRTGKFHFLKYNTVLARSIFSYSCINSKLIF